MHKETLGRLWLLPLVLAAGGCSREPTPQFDSMSEQDITRIVQDAIVATIGDPDQTDRQRRISLEQLRYSTADLQIKTMHNLFKDWSSFEKKHPRRWYHWLGIGTTWEPARNMTIIVGRMSAESAIEQACGVSSATANRKTVNLDDGFSVAQIASAYAEIDQDVARCMGNRQDTIKAMEALAAPSP